jgi:protein SCO1
MNGLLVLLWIMVGLVSPALPHDENSAAAPLSGDPIAGKAGIDQRVNAQIPLDLAFRDERGEAVMLNRFFDGKPVLLALVYYNCDRVCPLVLEGLGRSLRPLDFAASKDYRVIAVSIDPNEGPQLASEKKRVLGARHLRPGAENGWHLLTGSQQSIEALARATGFRYTSKDTDNPSERFIHAAATLVITPEGRIARYFYGFDYPPRELRLSMVEASANRIGSTIDQLLLLCYAYDPTRGKYTLSILNVLRISGAATFLALGGFLAFSLRRERPTKRDTRIPSS